MAFSEVSIPNEVWDKIVNIKHKYIERGVTPNWIFLSKYLVLESPVLLSIKIISSMRVHICNLPDGIDIMMVRLYDD